MMYYVREMVLFQCATAFFAYFFGYCVNRLSIALRQLGEPVTVVAVHQRFARTLKLWALWALGCALLQELRILGALPGHVGYLVWRHGGALIGVPALVYSVLTLLSLSNKRRIERRS